MNRHAEEIRALGNGYVLYVYFSKRITKQHWCVLWCAGRLVATATGLESREACLAWAHKEAGIPEEAGC